jgi:plasmid stabilization system protein ParE
MTGRALKVWIEAQDDFEQAAAWYEQQAPGLAEDFARQIEITFEKIVLNPDLFPIYNPQLRLQRVLVTRFPFKVFYRTEQTAIHVCAILHVSQDDWLLHQRVRSDR